MAVPVLMSVDGAILNVRIAAAEKERIGGEVWLCPVAKTVPVQIGRGENHGRTITYHNVVRRWLKLGNWAGSAAAWSIPLANFKSEDIDTAAIMLQEGTKEKPGIVLGAAMIPIGSDAPESR
jgi:hypothetical protein